MSGALLIVSAIAACTPVSLPELDGGDGADAPLAYDPAARRLEVGEQVPDFELIGADGRPTRLSAMRDAVLVVTFYSADRRGEAMLDRLRAVDEALVDRLAAATRVLAVRLDADASPERLGGDAERRGSTRTRWTFALPAEQSAAAMTGALGVAVWESAGGEVRHTLGTVVLDRRGRVADRFAGLDGWSSGDLIAAIDAAVDR